MNTIVRGLSFLGIRTEQYEAMKHLFGSVLGMKVKHDEKDFAAFIAPDGSRIELFGPETEWASEHAHFTTGPVGGFEVADIHQAKELLEKNGIELLTGIEGKTGRTQWVHFRGPDGNVYEIVHHPDLG